MTEKGRKEKSKLDIFYVGLIFQNKCMVSTCASKIINNLLSLCMG